jgi:hypothetical protein
MGRGIIGTVALFGTVVFAVPVAFIGLDFLLDGKTATGAGFLAAAVLMVVVEEWAMKPTDVATDVAADAASNIVSDPEAGENADE